MKNRLVIGVKLSRPLEIGASGPARAFRISCNHDLTERSGVYGTPCSFVCGR